MTADLETGSPAPPEAGSKEPRSRWEAIIWPRWLPVRARLPLIAQITGATALVAALAMPRWSEVAPAPPVPQPTTVAQESVAPPPPVVAPPPVSPARRAARKRTRPAHLNLDVRHSFRSVDVSVTVDGARVLETRVAGSGKRFGVFGKRAERGFTKSLDLSPGVRVVRVRVRSEADKFDQTRVERFDLASASVAGMRIEADKSGLAVLAERPPSSEREPEPEPVQQVATIAHVLPLAPVAPAAQIMQAGQAAQAAQEAGALAELYKTLRSILIAVAGFIGSAATGVVVQEFMRSRRGPIGR